MQNLVLKCLAPATFILFCALVAASGSIFAAGIEMAAVQKKRHEPLAAPLFSVHTQRTCRVAAIALLAADQATALWLVLFEPSIDVPA